MRRLKFIGIILAALFILGAGINFWANQKILKEIESIATVSCDDLSINIFTKHLTIKQLKLEKQLPSTSDSTLIKRLQISIPLLEINGCDYLNFLLNDELCLQSIQLQSPQIKLLDQALNETDINHSPSPKNTKIEPLKTLKIEEILLHNGQVEGIAQQNEWLKIDTFSSTVQHLMLDFTTDSLSIDWEGINSEFRQVKLNQSSNKNQLFIAQVTINSEEKHLRAQDLKWTPKQNKIAFMQDLTYRKARLDVAIPDLTITDFSLKDLLLKQLLAAKKIELEQASLAIYADKNVPACTTCYKPYMHEQFQDSPIKINIDSIIVKNSLVLVEVLEKGKEQSGNLNFKELYASVYNINHGKNELTDVDIHSKFMDEAVVNLHFGFWLNSVEQDYEFNAEVNHFSLEKINPFLTYAANARIQRGKVEHLKFKGVGHQKLATGEMEFRYKDLEITLLNKKKKRKKLLSKIVNGLLVQKENPDGKKFHQGKMYFERITHKSFISNWWKTIQTGFQSTMFPDILLKEELKNN